jgi:hypothetical protein
MAALRDASAQIGIALPNDMDLRLRVAPSGDSELLFETAITVARPRGPCCVVGVASEPTAAVMLAAEKLLQLMVASR